MAVAWIPSAGALFKALPGMGSIVAVLVLVLYAAAVMEVYPYARAFFVPFVIVTSFAVLSLFIALIVNPMQSEHIQDREAAEAADITAHAEREELLFETRALRDEVRVLRGERADRT